MKNRKRILLGLLVMLTFGGSFSFSPTAHSGGLSGANCTSANLGQALLGMGNSQLGITNNSNIPLFIVCNVDFEGDFSDIIIEATFPAGGGTVECTFRIGVFGAAEFLSASVIIVSGTDPGGFAAMPPIDPRRGINGVSPTMGTIGFAAGLNRTVVCALDPGEGIAWVLAT